MIRVISAPNIALIKYWGNRNNALRLPAADSLSITLDQPTVEVVVKKAEIFSAMSFAADGSERILSEKESARLLQHFNSVQKYVHEGGLGKILPEAVSVEIHSKIPTGVGLASSAAVFSALAEGYAGFIPGTSRRDISVLARLGSGSASRSVYGGFVAMIAGEGDGVSASYAQQVVPESHWKLYDVIVVPSHSEKETGSTEGHALAQTSPLFEKRIFDIGSRQQQCIDAILSKDFQKLQRASEEDNADMHAVMRSSTPSLEYLSEKTYEIVRGIEELRAKTGLAVLYTMDAGPTVHLICEGSALAAVREYADAQFDCAVFVAGVGSGSRVLESV
jgi:diphosphomevalonate decarboxylase